MKEELQKRLIELQDIRKDLEEKKYDDEIDELEREYIYFEIDRVIDEILDIKRKLLFLKGNCKVGKIVDIRELGSGKTVKNYLICIHNTTEVVGNISYRGYHIKKSLGDIGYEILEKYRGKNYAYHALCLLGDLLKEQGVDDFWITTEKRNIASRKTIEKYGGVCFGEEENTLFFSCETRRITDEDYEEYKNETKKSNLIFSSKNL